MVRSARRLMRKSLIILTLGGTAVVGTQIYLIDQRFRHLLPENVEHNQSCSGDYIRLPSRVTDARDMASLPEKYMDAGIMVHRIIHGPKALGMNPWHLLRILKSESLTGEHFQALLTMASASYSEGLAREIAQACDMKTAVKLARIPDVNLNLFMRPPASPALDVSIEGVYNIVKQFQLVGENSCADHFIKVGRSLTEAHKTKELPQGWEPETIRTVRPAQRDQILELYLRALLHHSQALDRSLCMIKNRLLPILQQMIKNVQFNASAAVKSLAVQIVASMSQFEECHIHIFQAGWVGLLAELMRSSDPSLRLAAGKALANMDDTTRAQGVLDPSIYFLNPSTPSWQVVDEHRELPQVGPWDVDVVFVHGLLGGVFWTWRQSDAVPDASKCWPGEWLPEDLPGMRILGLDYASTLTHWGSSCPADSNRRSIEARAEELMVSLRRAGVGRRPVVFVAHSMGGILVKRILVEASKSEDAEVRKMAQNCRAVVMISVPHNGSAMASLHPTVRLLLLPSVEVAELKKGSSKLDRLNQEFLQLLKHQSVAVVSMVEMKKTPVGHLGMQFQFVEPSSADLGVGEMHYIVANHMDICKPVNRYSFVYRRLVKLLSDVRTGSPPKDLTS